MRRKMTLLIVDDEPLARRKIRSFCLEDYGFEIVAEAENGEEAWSSWLKVKPDIVVTDIGMPVIDGLTLLKRIRASGRPTKVLMLTCYEEFEKAKLALKLGASDYLTKLLLEKSELVESLKRMSQIIEQEEQMARAMWRERVQEAAERSVHALEAAYDGESPRAYLMGGLRLTPQLCEKLGSQQDRWTQVDGRRVLFRLRPQLWVILFCADRNYKHADWSQEVRAELRKIAEHLRETMVSVDDGESGSPSIAWTLAMSSVFYKLHHLPRAVCELRAGLDLAFYMDAGGVSEVWNVREKERSVQMDTAAFSLMTQKVHQAGKERDATLLRTQIEEWLQAVCLMKPTPIQAQMMVGTLMAMASSQSDSEGVELVKFTPVIEREAIHISQLRQHLYKWLQHVEQAWAQEPASLRQEIRKAIQYVQQHYAEEIDLQQTARHVNLSATWFGALFRAQTGQSFHEYVTRFRLERARELLMTTDLKVYEIAQQVGIPNARYFSRLFVESFAVRPLDCRKNASDRSGLRA